MSETSKVESKVEQAIKLAERIVRLEEELADMKTVLNSLLKTMTELEKQEYRAGLAAIIRKRIRERTEIFKMR